MSNQSQDGTSALLRPSTMLSNLLITSPYEHERFVAGGWNEFELIGRPDSLEQFAGLFGQGVDDDNDDDRHSKHFDQRRFIRVPGGSFVCVSFSEQPKDFEANPIMFARPYQESQFRILASVQGSKLEFKFWSVSAIDAVRCLEFLLVKIPNTYERMEIKANHCFAIPSLFPLNVAQLHTMLRRHSGRVIQFHKTTFLPDHCLALATGGSNNCVELRECEFLDRGNAFVVAFAGRKGNSTGLCELVIDNSSLFDYTNWKIFLSLLRGCPLKSLTLREQFLSDEEMRALADSRIGKLQLESCTMENGSGLLRMLEEDRGPKRLTLSDTPIMDSEAQEEWWRLFSKALSGNTHLTGLCLSQPAGDEFPSDLISALETNKGLYHLSLNFMAIAGEHWTKTMSAIEKHPKLQSLEFSDINIHDVPDRLHDEFLEKDEFDRLCRTKTLFSTLRRNHRLHEVKFDKDTFEQTTWENKVAPQLEMNRYHERFAALRKYKMDTRGDGLLGSAMAIVSNTPCLVNILLSRHLDSVVGGLMVRPSGMKNKRISSQKQRGPAKLALPPSKKVKCTRFIAKSDLDK